jgi:VCBS repeat-containing protein
LTPSQVLTWLSADQVNKLANDVTGSVDLAFNAPTGSLDFLAQGQSLNLDYVITLDDGKGGISTQTVSVTVLGTNDVPTLGTITSGAVLDVASTPILGDTEGLFGQLASQDLDANAVLHYGLGNADSTDASFVDPDNSSLTYDIRDRKSVV